MDPILSSLSQLKKAEEARDAEAADLDALTQEFTLRIGEAEKKMQTVLKVKCKVTLNSLFNFFNALPLALYEEHFIFFFPDKQFFWEGFTKYCKNL